MNNLKPCLYLLVLIFSFATCKPGKTKQETAPFLTAKDVIRLNQLIYKDSSNEAITQYAPDYKAVFIPKAVGGNYAIIAKKKTAEQYALVIRGSVIEFSNEGFQNFILQDFNIFKIKKWEYADTAIEAYISKGAYIGFQNLLQLKDTISGLTLKEYIQKNIPAHASLVITGHSLGGNLAYPLAGYLKKELPKTTRLQLITFGAPAAGNEEFVLDMEKKFPDAERYVADRDIATVFPDTKKISAIGKMIGLDSALRLGNININGLDTELNGGTILDIAGEILEKTNVINKTNRYVQSEKHYRKLADNDTALSATPLSADAIFGKAYQYHRVDAYAGLLGVPPLEDKNPD
jgi:hypothetical protein